LFIITKIFNLKVLDLIFSFAGNVCDYVCILDSYYYYYHHHYITLDNVYRLALNFLEGKEEGCNKEFFILPLNLSSISHPPLSELLIVSPNIPPTLYTHFGV
jgi:hypothetical protein